MSVSESQINVVYKVDDRTGPLVDVGGRQKWLDDQELGAESNAGVHVFMCWCVH